MTFPFNNIIVHVTGEPDVGKTTFCLECGAKPQEIAFFDADVKGSAIARQLNFGVYHNLVAMGRGMKEVELHEMYLRLIDNIAQGQYRAVIWDGYQQFEKTFQPYVAKQPRQFREQYSPMGQIKGAEIWLASFDYEAEILSQLQECADLVLLTTHLKSYNIGGRRVPGRFVPDCKRPLVQKSSLRIWLRHNPDGPEPIGLVLKRIAKHQVTDDGIKATSVLPRRIKPCTWSKLRWYWENPLGDRQPTPEEIPDAFEISLLEGTLTDDQKRIFEIVARDEGDADIEFPIVDKAQIEEMLAAGKQPLQIAQELTLPLPVILSLIKEG